MSLPQAIQNKADSQLQTIWNNLKGLQDTEKNSSRYVQILKTHETPPKDGVDEALPSKNFKPADRPNQTKGWSDVLGGSICVSLEVNEYWRGDDYKGYTLTAVVKAGTELYHKTLHFGPPQEEYRAHDWKLIEE